MQISWPDHSKQSFGKEILRAAHTLGQSNLFSTDGLAHLLDLYPRESLDIWTFADNRDGEHPSMRGRAPKMSGHEIMEAVKHGRIWLNLRRASDEIGSLQPIADAIFGSLEAASGRRTMKQDMGLLISSPNVHVQYHLDIPMVSLFQLRGRKRIWIYPTEETFAPSEYIEGIVHMTREEDLPYKNAFDQHARVFDLEPGMAVTWPQLAPHRIQNANCVNVSLSCEFMTMQSLVNANAIYTNAYLRKNMRLLPKALNGMDPGTLGKAAFARAHKAITRRGPRTAPTPVSFELDTSKEDCVRSLYA